MRRRDGARARRTARVTLLPMLACAASLALPPAAHAGTWKGGVSHRDKPAVGATVTICGESATTNNSGRFRLSLPDDPQTCTIVVRYQGRESTAVQSGPQSYLSLTLRNGPDGWVIQIK